jgi:hypothetical protein
MKQKRGEGPLRQAMRTMLIVHQNPETVPMFEGNYVTSKINKYV